MYVQRPKDRHHAIGSPLHLRDEGLSRSPALQSPKRGPRVCQAPTLGPGDLGSGTVGLSQFLTVILTPELKALPPGPKASDTKVYEVLGTVVVSQKHNHPYWVRLAVQTTGAL
jgi:hypothetical protein